MKTILITGSNSDIGIAVAKALAQRPAQMALHYFSDRAKTERLAAWLEGQGVRSRILQADLTDAKQAGALLNATQAHFGDIDALLNVVGPFVYQDILLTPPEQWQADIALNLHSCFHTCHYALPMLRRTQGHIVNFAFAGVENLKAWPMSTGYCAAKLGVVALTKSLAVALAADKVRANALCPGLVEEGQCTAEERQRMASEIPFGRPIRPDEIGKTLAWLLWDSPETLTGTTLSVAGGWEY